MRRPTHPWRSGHPTPGIVVEVWHGVCVILATWTGKQWQTVDGAPLPDVTHWRER